MEKKVTFDALFKWTLSAGVESGQFYLGNNQRFVLFNWVKNESRYKRELEYSERFQNPGEGAVRKRIYLEKISPKTFICHVGYTPAKCTIERTREWFPHDKWLDCSTIFDVWDWGREMRQSTLGNLSSYILDYAEIWNEFGFEGFAEELNNFILTTGWYRKEYKSFKCKIGE